MFKTLVILLSVITISTLLILSTLNKLSPSLIDNTLSYCKSTIGNILLLPHGLSNLPAIMFLLLILVFITLSSINLIKIKLLKNTLQKKKIRNKKIEKLVFSLGLNKKVYLVKDNTAYAYCLGIVRPKIYISTEMLKISNKKELEAILIHEKYHLNNRDTLLAFLFSISKPFMLFFPLLADIERNYKIEREIKADREVFKKYNNNNSLTSLLEKLLILPQQNINFATAMADYKTLEPRIKVLINNDFKYRKYKGKNILLSVIVFFFFLTFTALPTKAFEVHSENSDSIQFCITKNINITPNINNLNKLYSSNTTKASLIK